jgi:hypothetical protein
MDGRRRNNFADPRHRDAAGYFCTRVDTRLDARAPK